MAINPISMPQPIPQSALEVDWSPLAQLGQSIKDAQTASLRKQTLASLGTNGDPMTAARTLLAAGDIQGATTLANLGRDQRDFQFRQQEAQRAQGNTDRSFGLQQKAMEEKPQYQTIEDANGQKRLIKIDPFGKGITDVTPGGAQEQTNPFSPGKQNENQSKDSGFATRMFQAEKTLRETEGAGTSLGQTALSKVPIAGNYMVSDDFQRFDQAKRNFVNSVLRRESGAAISESEFQNAEKQYFPQPGDSAAKLKEKRQNRADAIRSVAGGGGPSYRPPFNFDAEGNLVPMAPKAAPQAAASPAAAPQPGKVNPSDAIAQARAAVAAGADPKAVAERLKSLGITGP